MKSTHGHTRNGKFTKTYMAWMNMIRRCTNKNSDNYPRYGGRGITVCKKWRKFQGFLDDMGIAPQDKTLDRIDNYKGYCKENCRWATIEQQSLNRRTTTAITYAGKTQSIRAWAREFDIANMTLNTRLHRGWTMDEIKAIKPASGHRNVFQSVLANRKSNPS